MRSILAAALLAALPLAPAAAERFPLADHPAILGVVSLPPASPGERAPAVLLLPDALGPDRRADPYVDALNAAGFLVLEVDLEAVAEAADLSPADSVVLLLRELARDPRAEPGRIGILGFGAGGRAALLAPVEAARVALYPGCADLPAVTGRVLIVHGAADAANTAADCARPGGERAEIAGAGYAWDRPPHGGEGPSLLPRPDGGGRILATPHPSFWAVSVPLVVQWLQRELRDAG